MPAVRTRAAIVASARALITAAAAGDALPSVGAVAAHAGVSRLSVYHHFGSKAGLERAVAAEGAPARFEGETAAGPPADQLRHRIETSCARWAANPLLFRRLPAAREPGDRDVVYQLAIDLAAADQLRPGCSLKEAEDVIGLVTSFAGFDQFHADGRRSVPAVVEILYRLAGAILTGPA
jgi:AcrR family transcriptional regulator